MNRFSSKHIGAAIAAGVMAGAVAAWFQWGWNDMGTLLTLAPAITGNLHATNFTLSVAYGAAFGALVTVLPIVSFATGAAFGLCVWLGVDIIAMPLMRLAPPPWTTPLNQQSLDLVGHAIWGLVLGVFFRYACSRLIKPTATGINETIRIPVAESVSIF